MSDIVILTWSNFIRFENINLEVFIRKLYDYFILSLDHLSCLYFSLSALVWHGRDHAQAAGRNQGTVYSILLRVFPLLCSVCDWDGWSILVVEVYSGSHNFSFAALTQSTVKSSSVSSENATKAVKAVGLIPFYLQETVCANDIHPLIFVMRISFAINKSH